MVGVLPPVRARIGLIIPSTNRLAEPQFRRYAPPGVETHVTRVRMTPPHHVPLLDLFPRIAEAAQVLDDSRCDIIALHCTGSSMEAGLAAERQVVETIRQATGRRATTTASAVVEAFRALRVRRLVLVSPYQQHVNDHEISFLAQAGLEVLRDRGMGWASSDAFIAAPPSLWLQVTQEEADPRAEAYFLSCANIQSIDVIEELESRLQRPVVTSSQATLWYCLRACGLPDVPPGLGQLSQLALPTHVSA